MLMEASLDQIKDFLKEPRTFAIFGASTKSEKAGNYVPKFLMNRGHNIIPINPFVEEILNISTKKNLDELDQNVDAIIIYRNAEAALEVVKEAIKREVNWIWLPEGVISDDAKNIAIDAGKTYVQDKCPKDLIEKWIKKGEMN